MALPARELEELENLFPFDVDRAERVLANYVEEAVLVDHVDRRFTAFRKAKVKEARFHSSDVNGLFASAAEVTARLSGSRRWRVVMVCGHLCTLLASSL